MKVRNRAQYFQLFRGKLSHRDMFLLDFAYNLSKYAHGYLGQVRDTGERYFDHPRAVSVLIAQEIGIFDLETHLATLLHDCPEDTYLLDSDRIEWVFGKSVAKTVLAVTKMNNEKAEKAVYLGVYFQNIVKSGWRAPVIKCADRIHNLRSLPHTTEQDLKKVLRQIEETEQYFPKLIPVIEKHNPEVALVIEKLLAKELRRLKKFI